MIHQYRLKASTKTALFNALENAGIFYRDAEKQPTRDVAQYAYTQEGCRACVYLGKLVNTPAVIDSEGNVVQAETYLAGWHADVLMRQETTFDCEVVTPATPRHSFAGIA